jgi:hypothetical protein
VADLTALEGRVSALERARGEPTIEAVRSRRLRIRFPAANTARDIPHGLTGVPDGYRIEWANANIFAVPGLPWTVELAHLQASAANAEAVVTFYLSSEAVLDV